jgi:hypothetical protein
VKEEKGGVVLAARITSPIQLASRARRRNTSKGERRRVPPFEMEKKEKINEVLLYYE